MLKDYFDLQMFAEESVGMAEGSLAMSNPVEASGTEASQLTTDNEGAESFDSLISGKYKADYEAKVKGAIDKRFKNQKDFEAKYNATTPILMMVAERYGIDTSDMSNLNLEALTQNLEADNSLYEKEAFEKGMDVATLREMKRLERENRIYAANEQRQIQEAEGRAQYEQLMRTADSVKAIYPSFNLEAELQNENFGRLVATGVPMQTAYEVVHKDEILSSGMQYATQATAAKITNSIMSGMGRPTENSMQSQSTAALSKDDPRTYTKTDFERIKREAEKGSKIYLR